MTDDKLARANAFIGKVQIGNITGKQGYEQAADLLKKVKRAHKVLDEAEKKETKPLVEEAKEVRARFKPGKQRCKDLESQIKAKMLAHTEEQEKKRLELAAAPVTRESMNALANSTPQVVGGVSYVEITDHELVDISKVPVEYLELNGSAINKALRADPDLVIPGVERAIRKSLRSRA